MTLARVIVPLLLWVPRLAMAAEPANDDDLFNEVSDAPAAEPETSAETTAPESGPLAVGSAFAGAGFSDRLGPTFGVRLGGHFWLSDPRALGSTRVAVGARFAYSAAHDVGDLEEGVAAGDPSVDVDAWTVMLNAEAGFGVRIPLVVLEPTLGVGLARPSVTRCGDGDCDTSTSTRLVLLPGATMTTAPTSPIAPVFVGAEVQYVLAFGASDLSGVAIMGMLGVALEP